MASFAGHYVVVGSEVIYRSFKYFNFFTLNDFD